MLMSSLGNGRDWKDPDMSEVHRGNVTQVRFLLISITPDLFIFSCQLFTSILG